ncbi:sorting nexin-6-like isoform X2 [Bolinopsis microptera]|uniref:sorting nexin-6-like isoform X2 n=1 Tax=Bolinopsis microptera TaxID=2820187 RepID=UPI00307964BC
MMTAEDENEPTREHASTVSLSDENDGRLTVSISDAVSELETVKFTIQTKTALPSFSQHQMSVIRCHEEFIWLHDMLSENPEYAGYIIPPAPPKPDFEEARDKLTRVTAAENTMTEEEYKKLRKELESDYLALFKKTVAMHEIYLLRIAAHNKLREDSNFRVFLEYAKDLKVRSKNKKEIIGGFFKSMTKNVDEALLSGQKDKDEFFIERRTFLEDYHLRIKETTKKSESLSASTNGLSFDYMQVAGCLALLSTRDPSLQRFMAQSAITFESLQKLQKRTSTDEDLKLTDLFKYYQRETQAAKSLLYRRGRALADKEIAEGKLEQAQKKFKDIPTAEAYVEDCKIRFESISDMAKTELDTFKNRRLETYRKHLVDMSELQIRHSQSIISELTKGLELLKDF